MTNRTCADCGRPLREEETKYCPNCLAKRAKKARNAGGIAGAIGSVAVTIVGIVVWILTRGRKT